MSLAVDLHADEASWTVEVQDVACHRMLATKDEAGLLIAKLVPRVLLGTSHPPSKASCNLNTTVHCVEYVLGSQGRVHGLIPHPVPLPFGKGRGDAIADLLRVPFTESDLKRWRGDAIAISKMPYKHVPSTLPRGEGQGEGSFGYV